MVNYRLKRRLTSVRGDSRQKLSWINMRQCVKFVPTEGVSSSEPGENDLCKCGHKFKEHDNDVKISREDSWSEKMDTRAYPTNAFGYMEITGFVDTGRMFARLDVDTPMETVEKLLFEYFELEQPKMLISVTGGAKGFRLDRKIKESFKRGLTKVIQSCGAWFTTGGTFAGVMKDVGGVVHDFILSGVSNENVTALGIASWGCIQNSKFLAMSDNERRCFQAAQYRIDKFFKDKECCLDPNHTHFLLVDDGTKHKYGVEIAFRAKLEKYLKEKMSVPVVQLVAEGGPRTLETVMETLEIGMPVVILRGTGRVADVISYAYDNSDNGNNNLSEDVKDRLGTSLKLCGKKSFDKLLGEGIIAVDCPDLRRSCVPVGTDALNNPHWSMTIRAEHRTKGIRTMLKVKVRSRAPEECIGMVEKCLLYRHLITVTSDLSAAFSQDKPIEFDVCILEALMKGNKDNVQDQIRLALALNRADIARGNIFVDNMKFIEMPVLFEFMFDAIKDGKAEFVELLMENGVSLKEFLTLQCHERFYQNDYIPKNSHVKELLHLIQQRRGKCGNPVTIADVRSLLKQLIGFGILQKGDVPKDFRSPFLCLFIWSVLTGRLELAHLFLVKGKHPIATALVGFAILKALMKYAYDPEVKEHLHASAEKFNVVAVGVLNECFSVDEKKTHRLLVQELPEFGNSTCLRLAYDVGNRYFISQKPIQNLLNGIWFGGISFDNSTAKMLLAPILLGLFILKFNDDNEFEKCSKYRELPGEGRPFTELKQMEEPIVSNRKGEENGCSELHHNDRCMFFRNFFKNVKTFYTAPVMVFAHNMISYIVFLLLFSYMLLVKFSAEVSTVEILLYVWVGVLFIEEVRQAATATDSVGSRLFNNRAFIYHTMNFLKPMKSYIKNDWNKVDVLTIGLFTCAAILRSSRDYDYIEAARIVYGTSLLVFFFRMLRVFSVNQQLGPKLTMIQRMMVDLMYFIIILMVFIISYAITAYAILHPNSDFNIELVMKVLRLGYFNIYGELFLDDIEISEPHCSFDPVIFNNGTLPKCPERFRQVFAVALMGVYILISNVLLLNILIAMFGNTFNKVQGKTTQYWFYQRFSLVLEFYTKPFLPVPLAGPLYIWMFIQWVKQKCCKRCCDHYKYKGTLMNIKVQYTEERSLARWEALMTDIYMYRLECQERDSVDNRIKAISDRLDSLKDQMGEMHHEREKIFLRAQSR